MSLLQMEKANIRPTYLQKAKTSDIKIGMNVDMAIIPLATALCRCVPLLSLNICTVSFFDTCSIVLSVHTP